MSRRLSMLGIIALSLLLAIQVSGCTVIGFAVGEAADRKAKERQRYRMGDLARIERGSKVQLLMDDSTRVAGKYLGALRQEESAYRPRYEAWRAQAARAATFPAWSERVVVDPGGQGPFMGFVLEGVLIRSGTRGIHPVTSSGMLRREDGSALDLLDVQDLALAGELPLATALRVETDDGERQIAVDRVVQVDGTGPQNAAIRGLVAGLAFDGLAIYILTRKREPARSPQCDTQVPTYWLARR